MLCLNQTDPEDKEAVIGAMSALCSEAYLTVVAADGEDTRASLRRLHEGFPSEESTMQLKADMYGDY